MNEEVFVVLPLPPRVLSPNSSYTTLRGQFAKAAATKKLRRITAEAVREEGVESAPWGKVEVSAAFYHKTKRRRDADNAIGSLKAAYDGIVDAGLVLDDTPEHMERRQPTFAIDKDFPRVELTITRKDQEA